MGLRTKRGWVVVSHVAAVGNRMSLKCKSRSRSLEQTWILWAQGANQWFENGSAVCTQCPQNMNSTVMHDDRSGDRRTPAHVGHRDPIAPTYEPHMHKNICRSNLHGMTQPKARHINNKTPNSPGGCAHQHSMAQPASNVAPESCRTKKNNKKCLNQYQHQQPAQPQQQTQICQRTTNHFCHITALRKPLDFASGHPKKCGSSTHLGPVDYPTGCGMNPGPAGKFASGRPLQSCVPFSARP